MYDPERNFFFDFFFEQMLNDFSFFVEEYYFCNDLDNCFDESKKVAIKEEAWAVLKDLGGFFKGKECEK